MVLDEFMSVQQMQLGHMWNKAAAWRAFKDVVDQGLIAFLAARCVCGCRTLQKQSLCKHTGVSHCLLDTNGINIMQQLEWSLPTWGLLDVFVVLMHA